MKSASSIAFLVAVGLLGGCATQKASRPDQKDAPRKAEVVTTGIDPADFKRVADLIRDSIASSGVLNKINGNRATIGVSTVRNDTMQRLNTDNLTGAITTALQEDASVMINRGIGPDGRPIYEDPKSAEGAQVDRFLKGTKVEPSIDYGFSGTINETTKEHNHGAERNCTLTARLTQGDQVIWQGVVEFQKLSRNAKTFSKVPQLQQPHIHPAAPPKQGKVLEIMPNNEVLISLGSAHGMKPGDLVDLYQIRELTDTTGSKLLTEETFAGQVALTLVNQDTSVARPEGPRPIKAGFLVKPSARPQ